MSTKNPFFVSPPSDFQQFGSGKFLLSWAGKNIKLSLDGGQSWQYLPDNVNLGNPTPLKKLDTSANTSLFTFTVPTNKIWELISTHIVLTATGTVGNRHMSIKVKNSDGNYIGNFESGLAVTASTAKRMNFGHALTSSSAFVGENTNISYSPIFPCWMAETDRIEIAHNGVDANDDIEALVVVREYSSLILNSIEINATDLLIDHTLSLVSSSEQQVQILKLS